MPKLSSLISQDAQDALAAADSPSATNPFATVEQIVSGDGRAASLKTTGSPVNVSAAAPPNTGDVLRASDATHAVWTDALTQLEADMAALQADLAAHEANASNPHSVTKTQVGLSNVTNDVQLKADFSGYTSKATPTSSDVGTINDAAASGAVKKYTLGTIPIAGDVDGTLAASQVKKIHETSGPTALTIGAIGDGQMLVRSGTGVVGSSSRFQALLDLNLTTDPNFTFSNGSNTWHSLTWTGVNIAAATDQFAVVNGTGLVIDANASNVDRYLTADSAPYIYLPFSQIPGYVHGSSIVRVWFQSFTTGANSNFETGMRGIETVPYSSNARYGWAWNQTDTTNQPEVLAGSVAPTMPSALGSTYTACCLEMVGLDEVRFYAKIPTQASSAANSAEFDLSTFTLSAIWKASNPGQTGTVWKPSDIFAAAASNLAAFLGLKTVNTSNSVIVTFTRLRIECANI